MTKNTFLLLRDKSSEQIHPLCYSSTPVYYGQHSAFFNSSPSFTTSRISQAKFCSMTSELYQHCFSIQSNRQSRVLTGSSGQETKQNLSKTNTIILNSSQFGKKQGLERENTMQKNYTEDNLFFLQEISIVLTEIQNGFVK